MKIICPYCRKEMDFREVQADRDTLVVMHMIPTFGRHFNLVWAYLQLFGLSPFRMKAKKIRILMEEIKALWDSGEFAYQKKRCKISAAGIAEGLNIMVRRNFETALTNHNYLKSIMVSISEREAKEAGRLQEKALRDREEELLNREPDPATRRQNLVRVGNILKNIGGG